MTLTKIGSFSGEPGGLTIVSTVGTPSTLAILATPVTLLTSVPISIERTEKATNG